MSRIPRWAAPPLAACASAVALAAAAPAVTAAVPLPQATQINPAPPAAQTPGTGALPVHDLAGNGYDETEWKVKLTDPQVYALTAAGGTTAAASPAPPAASQLGGEYASRVLVRAPEDPADFNGRVVVEILNATTGVDLDILWQQSYEYFQRSGTIYVGIAAQPRTLFSQTLSAAQQTAVLPPALRQQLPLGFASRISDRYTGENLNLMTQAAFTAAQAGTNTAGDPALAWDLISQVGALAKSETGPFSGYDVEQVLATGWSQSAGYLTTYVNVIHPLHSVYDGFLLGARGGGGTTLQLALPGNPAANLLTIGNNVTQGRLNGGGAPVISLQTETDSKSAVIRKPDTDDPADRFRLYEVPGSAHNDEWAAVQSVQVIPRDTLVPGLPGCNWTGQDKITSNPVRYVLNASFAGLGTWAAGGTAAPAAPRITAPDGAPNGAGISGGNVVPGVDGITRDALGNALGGVRTPFVDAPSRSYKPISFGPLAAFCQLTGRETPLTSVQANDAYADWSAFLAAYDAAADEAQDAGFLLPGDRAGARAFAAQSYTVRPDAPTFGADASPNNTGSVTLSWKGPDPAAASPFDTVGYTLQRQREGETTWSTVETGIASRSYTIESEPEGTVRYRVRTEAVQNPPQHPNAPISVESDWSAASAPVTVDTTAPEVSVTCPATALLRGTASATVTASDALSGLAADPSGTVAIPTAAVGPQTITRTATDRAGNSATASCTTSVRYRSSGLVGFPEGSTITRARNTPVAFKIRLTDALGKPALGAVIRMDVARITGTTIGPYQPATPLLPFGSGNRFTYTALLKAYQYTLNTRPLGTGLWSVRVSLDDGTQTTVRLQLR